MAQACPVCGTPGHVCAARPGRTAKVIITDEREKATGEMAELSVYDVELSNGMSTQLRLSADEAKERGLTDKNKAKGQTAVTGEQDDDFSDERAQEAYAETDAAPVGSRAAKKAAASE